MVMVSPVYDQIMVWQIVIANKTIFSNDYSLLVKSVEKVRKLSVFK